MPTGYEQDLDAKAGRSVQPGRRHGLAVDALNCKLGTDGGGWTVGMEGEGHWQRDLALRPCATVAVSTVRIQKGGF